MTDEEIEQAKRELAEEAKRYRRASTARAEAGKRAIAKALDLLRAGVNPTEVARLSPFTDAYIRKAAREAHIPPARVTGYAKTKDAAE
jgi:hypothetical protein